MKIRTGLKLLTASALLATSVVSASAADRVFFGIATGGTGGTYYPLGGMLAQVVSNKATVNGVKISATAETGNASVANSKLLGKKGIESAFVAADVLDSAYKGTNQFKGKALKNIRALGALYPEAVQLVTLKSSKIMTFSDLKGKTVSSGAPGSGQWNLLGSLLDANSMNRDTDITEDYSSFSQSAEKIKDGNLTASLITAGAPTASITELANGHQISIVPLSGKKIDNLLKSNPYYGKVTLPAGTYKGQDKPVQTLAVRAIWATHADVDDETVYQVVKALYENVETLGKVHPKGKEISLKSALDSISVPLHPGAEKYYREKGLIK